MFKMMVDLVTKKLEVSLHRFEFLQFYNFEKLLTTVKVEDSRFKMRPSRSSYVLPLHFSLNYRQPFTVTVVRCVFQEEKSPLRLTPISSVDSATSSTRGGCNPQTQLLLRV